MATKESADNIRDLAAKITADDYIRACRRDGIKPDATYLQRMRRPQFRVLDDRKILALDFYSAVLGKHERPFHVLELAHRAWHLGIETDVPAIAPIPATPVPAPRWLAIGPADASAANLGLSDPLALMFADCYGADQIQDVQGDTVLCNDADAFDVDDEAAGLVLDLMYPDDLRTRWLDPNETRYSAVRHHLTTGVVSLSPQGRVRLHKILKQRETLAAAGLHALTNDALYAAAGALPGAPSTASSLQLDLFAA